MNGDHLNSGLNNISPPALTCYQVHSLLCNTQERRPCLAIDLLIHSR